MEQQRAMTEPEPSFDRSQAEEALLMAARLQQEQRDRLTISELKRTAAEVDIAPEFVEQALSMLKAPGEKQPLRTFQAAMPTWVQVATCLAVIVAQVLLAKFAALTPVLMALPVWALTGLLATGLGILLPSGKEATTKGLSYLGLAWAACVSLFIYRHQVNGYHSYYNRNLELERLFLLFLLEAMAFMFARHFRRASAELAPKPADNLARSNGL